MWYPFGYYIGRHAAPYWHIKCLKIIQLCFGHIHNFVYIHTCTVHVSIGMYFFHMSGILYMCASTVHCYTEIVGIVLLVFYIHVFMLAKMYWTEDCINKTIYLHNKYCLFRTILMTVGSCFLNLDYKCYHWNCLQGLPAI